MAGSTNYPPATNIPNPEGFDFFLGYNSQENAHNYYPYTLFRNKSQIFFPDNENASTENCGYPLTQNCTWAEDVFVNTTTEFLSNSSKSESAFFLFLSFTSPHAGGIGINAETGIPAPYDTPQYANQSWPKVERDFASVITLQDQQVGQIVKELDSLGLGNDTVVFFASDNGAHNEGGHSYQFFESSGPLRGYKRSLHEGGVRSPLIVRWPGVVKPGVVVQQQWGFWDFLATAADIAGVPLSSLPVNDGYSLLPTLQGNSQDQPRYIYHEFCYPNEDKSGWGQAVRFMNWKAVRYNFSAVVALYDLVNDVGETTDVSGDSPDVVRLAVQYMDDAHSSGPKCGYLPPHPNN